LRINKVSHYREVGRLNLRPEQMTPQKENMPTKSKNSKRNHKLQGSGNSSKRKSTSTLKARKRNLLKSFSSPVRKEKVRIAKKRLASGFYSSSQINTLIAERIIQDFRNFGNI